VRGFNGRLDSRHRCGLVGRLGCRQWKWQGRRLKGGHREGHSGWLRSGHHTGKLRWERGGANRRHRSRYEGRVLTLQLHSDVISLLSCACCARQVQSQVPILNRGLELAVDVILQLRCCRVVGIRQILAHIKRHVSSHAAVTCGLSVTYYEVVQISGVDVLDCL